MKIKKLISAALAAMLALGTFTVLPAVTDISPDIAVTAEAANSDYIIKTDKYGDKYIAGYKGKGGDIVLPKGFYVGEKAFKGNTNITSVTFPELYSVSKNAFDSCINLKKVVFEDEACICAEAFSYCINLKTVEIKGGIYNFLTSSAFFCCQSLEKVTIGEGTKDFYIGPFAFTHCSSLKSINIPKNCKMIYPGAFLGCFALDKLTIPEDTEFTYYNDTNDVDYPAMGYFEGAKTKNDALCNKMYIGKADGKTSVYWGQYSSKPGDEWNIHYYNYTPKKLTMTVTKNSEAEKYAQKYGIDYTYAANKNDTTAEYKPAAPENIKASKTSSSVTLTWDKVDGADAYKVWKYNEKTGKYEKYKTVTSAKCTVSGLAKGTKYKFKVTSLDKVDGKYKSGETSKAVSVTTKK